MAYLLNYDTALSLFLRAKDRAKGRRLGHSWRMFDDGNGVLALHLHGTKLGTKVATIHPNNTLTFHMDAATAKYYSATISMTLHTIIGATWTRISTGRYSVNGCEYFDGMQLNLVTGCVLNPRPNILDCIDDDVRLAWLRSLRKFKRHIKVLARLGVLANFEGYDSQYRITNETLIKLTHAIKTEDYSDDVMNTLIGLVRRRYNPVTNDIVVEFIFSTLNTYSLQLRQIYGVFGAYTEGNNETKTDAIAA